MGSRKCESPVPRRGCDPATEEEAPDAPEPPCEPTPGRTRTRTAAPRETRALRHGGRAEITIPGLDTARQAILDRLAASAPVRDAEGGPPAADVATVELAARALARVRSVDSWLAVHGYIDEETGEVKKAAEYVESATRTADGLLAKLGMNPKDRAALGVDIQCGFDLAAHWAEEDGSPDDALDGDAEEVEE